jgi:hypothetical protein
MASYYRREANPYTKEKQPSRTGFKHVARLVALHNQTRRAKQLAE